MSLIDLQSHSTVSDGELPPEEVVEAAAGAGVTVLALTDHDAVAGVPAAVAAGERLGVEVIPAIEMSSANELVDDLHICGYWVDPEKISPACEKAQEGRVQRAAAIIEKLRGFGLDVTLEDAIREAGGADAIGRPHIAKAAGASGDLGPFFEEYLVPGAKAFVAREWPSPAEACQVIRDAGGVPVIAHPYWDIKDPDEVEKLIRSLDLGGIEVFYPSHTREETARLLELARDLGIAATAASDFHGPDHRQFSRFGAYQTYGLGEPEIPPRP